MIFSMPIELKEWDYQEEDLPDIYKYEEFIRSDYLVHPIPSKILSNHRFRPWRGTIGEFRIWRAI